MTGAPVPGPAANAARTGPAGRLPAPPPVLAGQAFRDAMTALAAPLTIVTTRDGHGRRWGFTASSVLSASLDPPLVLVGVARASSCHTALTTAGEFVVNVLGEQHRELARRFAASGVDRFAGGDFDTWPGSLLPCLPDAAALFRCVTWDVVPAGDHDLVLGTLSEARTDDRRKALVWYRRDFHRPA